ncbi:MAG: hypothetical protein KC636_37620 [Myxococcales bacterium]|nr:hypothetical protein [Myxococcales bacterium]
MYLDRHRVTLLLKFADLPDLERATQSAEADLFLRVALDGATSAARAAFLELVGEVEGWPWSAIEPRELDLSALGGVIGAITYAPPALVLLLGVDLGDPDALQVDNWISDEVFASIEPRLQRWSPEALRKAIRADGWASVPMDSDESASEPEESEADPEPEPEDLDEGTIEVPQEDAPEVAPAVPWYRRPAFLISAGVGSVALVGLVYAMRRR